ncbi:MAG: WecB/TagA/CpsF family glycosyltransferase [Cyanobacteria bacterium P01_G01_bin.54]
MFASLTREQSPAPPLETQSVFALPIHLCRDYAAWVRSRLEAGQGTHIVTLNAEMAMLADQTPQLAQVIQQADLVVPDGAGVVFYLKLRRYSQTRCPGIELAAALIEAIGTAEQPGKIIFYGAAPGVAEQAAQVWRDRYPALEIITQNGYLDDSQAADFAEFLATEQPQLILVGLGVPRQEYWIAQHRQHCPQATWVGVGGSLDIWAGIKLRAPVWLRENNLEWFYRLYKEPWRWRRMLVLPKFAWAALWR